VDNVLNATVGFLAIFSLSILIERFLEIIKSIVDLLDSRLHWHVFWTARAYALKERLVRRLRIEQYMDRDKTARVLASFGKLLLGQEDDYTGTIPTISGDLIRILYIKIGTKVIGMACGILLAMSFNLDILRLMERYFASNMVTTPGSILNPVLTGVIIGLGTGPVHKLIVSIERKRETVGKGA
jgi:hypothetical protein